MHSLAIIGTSRTGPPIEAVDWPYPLTHTPTPPIRSTFIARPAGVRVVAEQGLIGMVCHSVDGTKIRAAPSRRTLEQRHVLEVDLQRVNSSIGEY